MTWDEPKRLTNIASHGLDFADARDAFEWETASVVATRPGTDGRLRFKAIGLLAGDLVSLIFAPLGTEAIAAISLRDASRKERKTYREG